MMNEATETDVRRLAFSLYERIERQRNTPGMDMKAFALSDALRPLAPSYPDISAGELWSLLKVVEHLLPLLYQGIGKNPLEAKENE